MKKYKVTFLPVSREVTVEEGTSLHEAALEAGIPLQGACGGKGQCGQCVVKVEAGNAPPTPHPRLSPERQERGYRLACRVPVTGDMAVSVPEESSLPAADIDFGAVALAEDEKKRRRVLRGIEILPIVETLRPEMSAPTLDDNLSDAERLRRALRSAGVSGEVRIPLGVLRDLPSDLRGARWGPEVSLMRDGERAEVVLVSPTGRAPRHGLAIDLGTTTVVAELVDLDTGGCLYRAAAYNRQLPCGADIISRIVHSLKPGGKERLRALALETIGTIADRLYDRTGLFPRDVAACVIAGNTTMIHLLLGVDASRIRLEPYIPAENRFPPYRAGEIGLPVNESIPVHIAPSIGSYVGGDVLAGVLASGMHRSDKTTLFIDAGTNGEIIFGNSDWMIGCACSTGPAFEGVGISCGMMAAPGAVESVILKGRDEPAEIGTIASAPARGLCGTGMIDLMAELFKYGIIDRKGSLGGGTGCRRVEERGGHYAYILRRIGEEGAEREIYLSEVDLKKLLRTKAAIQAAILSIVSAMDLDTGSIDRLVIAGRLGEAIRLSSAVGIGMLPPVPADRFDYMGNGSLWGANLLLLRRDARDELRALADRITYLDLSTHAGYMDEFVASLFIPHTNG